MSQIEGQPVEEQHVEGQQVPELAAVEEQPYASDEERLFAEEHERRAAEERGDTPPEPTPTPTPTVVDTAPLPQTNGDATPSPADAAGDKPAWYNDLSEEAKLAWDTQQQNLEQLQWQYSAVHGRLAPVQAENERLRRLAEQRQPGQPAPQSAPGGQPTPQAPTPVADFESKEFLEFAETYPDEAAQMKRLFAAQQTNVQRLEQRLDSIAQGLGEVQSVSTTQQMQNELASLEQRHPDWMVVRNSPEFAQWLGMQPAAVQPMVNSKSADECSYLLDKYKQDVYLYQLQQQAEGRQEPDPNPGQVRADQTASHRQTLIQTPTPDPQGGGVGVPGGQRPPQTAEEMWVEELERRARAQKQQRV